MEHTRSNVLDWNVRTTDSRFERRCESGKGTRVPGRTTNYDLELNAGERMVGATELRARESANEL